MKNIPFLAALCCLMISCKEGVLFEQKNTVPSTGWIYADSLQFTLPVADTSQRYNLYLSFEHSTDYPYQNLYYYVTTQFPSGKRISERVNTDFADHTGKWHGTCSSKKCLLPIVLQEHFRFQELGKYEFKISQFTRDSVLQGIIASTLRLEAAEVTLNK